MGFSRYFYSIWFVFILTLGANANDGFDDEDEFSDGSDDIVLVTSAKSNSNFSIYGLVDFTTTYNYAHDKPASSTQNDFRGFSSAKVSSDIKVEYKFNKNVKFKSNIKGFVDGIYSIKSDEYPNIPKDYDADIDIDTFYIQAELTPNIDFSFGRQIVVWGKSDNIRITDTINPLNNTIPGMVDIKDLKLGRTMTKFDYFTGNMSIVAMILNENRFSKLPQYGSDFASNDETTANSINTDEPTLSLENMGYALNLNFNLQGQDLSFYASNQFIDNKTYRSNMYGFAYSKVVSKFLIKTEVAYFDNYDDETQSRVINRLIGIDYNGISEGSISLEIANKDEELQYSLRFTQSYLNNTLDFTALYMPKGKDFKDGAIARVWFDYDYSDSVSLNYGFIDYIGGDDLMYESIKDNDRVFASIKYSF